MTADGDLERYNLTHVVIYCRLSSRGQSNRLFGSSSQSFVSAELSLCDGDLRDLIKDRIHRFLPFYPSRTWRKLLMSEVNVMSDVRVINGARVMSKSDKERKGDE